MTDELKALLEQTKDHVMSPAEIQAQRESWVRAMAHCEHGIADFEDCCQCRGGHSFVEHPCPAPGQEGKEFCELCGAPKPCPHENVIPKGGYGVCRNCGVTISLDGPEEDQQNEKAPQHR